MWKNAWRALPPPLASAMAESASRSRFWAESWNRPRAIPIEADTVASWSPSRRGSRREAAEHRPLAQLLFMVGLGGEHPVEPFDELPHLPRSVDRQRFGHHGPPGLFHGGGEPPEGPPDAAVHQ